MDPELTKLGATKALGVALSVAAPGMTMDEAQAAAGPMLAHLRALGFDVVIAGPRSLPAGHAAEAMKRTVDTETARLEAEQGR